MINKKQVRSMFDYPLKDFKSKQKNPSFFIDSKGHKWLWSNEQERFVR